MATANIDKALTAEQTELRHEIEHRDGSTTRHTVYTTRPDAVTKCPTCGADLERADVVDPDAPKPRSRRGRG